MKKSCDECNEQFVPQGGMLKDQMYLNFLENRQIILKGFIDDSVIEKVVMQIIHFNEQDDILEQTDKLFDRRNNAIRVYISSPGGDLVNGLSVVSAIRSSRTPVVTYALGMAASAAFVVLAAGHVRVAQEYSILMYHQLSGMGGYGKLHDMIDDVALSKKFQKSIDDIIVSCTKLTKQELDEINKCRSDKYFSAKEAKKLGIIDVVSGC